MPTLNELLKEVKLEVVSPTTGSAGTDVTSSAIDMQGFDGLLLVLTDMATANAGNYLKAQQSSDDAATDAYSDIAGSKVVPASNGDAAVLNIHRPMKRYIKSIVVRGGANTAISPVLAIKYNSRVYPQVNDVTNVMKAVGLIEPAEGTP